MVAVDEMDLPHLPVEGLLAEEDCPITGIEVGETVGYRCEECGAGDESVQQIDHEPECSLHGVHGTHHDPDEVRDEAALSPEYPVRAIRANYTDPGAPSGATRGEVVLWYCGECGNADETLHEIVHDQGCPLADD
jgi:hypothetical protein